MNESAQAQKAPPPKSVIWTIALHEPAFSEEYLDGLTEITIEINTEHLRERVAGDNFHARVIETVVETRTRVR